MTHDDIDILEQWWIEKSRINFFAYRRYLRTARFKYNWFIEDLCHHLQQFALDYQAGLKPILLLQTPPQHGKSIATIDLISWLFGRDNSARVIFASYSARLGVRCNLLNQRTISSEKYKKIFPNTNVSKLLRNSSGGARRTHEFFEILDKNEVITEGQFRNTTVSGGITGESLDIGIIDDAVKGRKEANSSLISRRIWEWYCDDFSTRFSEFAGLLVLMTRWTPHDLIGRLKEQYDKEKIPYKHLNYSAVAEKNERYRKKGEALFPALKSAEFLHRKKTTMVLHSWNSLYQGNPTVKGGEYVKEQWFKWWVHLPRLRYKIITVDTAQKTGKEHDFTDFKCWGIGYIDNCLYLLDHLRGKWIAPDLKKQATIFYKKHDLPRRELTDPILRAMYIEDKSSGIGLIQELKKARLKIQLVPRITDKILRTEDCSPYVESGYVYLNENVSDVHNTVKEAIEFPSSEFDDDWDTVMMAIETTYIQSNHAELLRKMAEG